MKKLLGIVVLGLLLSGNAYGDQQKKDSDTELIEKEATIVHYSGKHKPWSPKGIFSSEEYPSGITSNASSASP